MARKLKTFQTSLGFFDLAIAAPSMKAALEAWGADSNLFHQGEKGSDDPDVIAATMRKPGVVFRRPSAQTDTSTSMPNCPPIWAVEKGQRKPPAGRKPLRRRNPPPERSTKRRNRSCDSFRKGA